MRPFSWTSIVAVFFVIGCASDESVVCDRLAECDLMPEGLSAEKCEAEAVRQVPEDRLSRCAECVEDEECENLVEACRKVCQPGD